jgi:hypothetical protein
MIDTINFKIHNLKKHIKIVEILDKRMLGEGYSKGVSPIDKEDFEGRAVKILYRRYSVDWKTNKLIEGDYFHKLESSHYQLAYCIKESQDCILFNFSIPKLLYGTNVLQFVRHDFQLDYEERFGNYLKLALNDAYADLMKFFKWWFQYEFTDIPINFREVEITRIDFAYNQVFDSKSECFRYLHLLKKIKPPYLRETGDRQENYHTSIFYKNRQFSFKIYHKGTEYAAKDKTEHSRINHDMKREYFPREILQDFSDRILRYEITIRSSFMSRVYTQHLFRKDVPEWKELLADHNYLLRQGFWRKRVWSSEKNRFIRTGPKFGTALDPERGINHVLHPTFKKKMNYVRKVYSKKFDFFLEANNQFVRNHEPYMSDDLEQKDIYFDNKVLFSKLLFDRLADAFISKVNFFKLRFLGPYETLVKQLEDAKHQADIVADLHEDIGVLKKINKQINLTTLKIIFEKLEYLSWEELVLQGFISRRTMYNYKKFLRETLGEVNFAFEEKSYLTYDFESYDNFVREKFDYLRHLFKFDFRNRF